MSKEVLNQVQANLCKQLGPLFQMLESVSVADKWHGCQGMHLYPRIGETVREVGVVSG